MMAYTATEMDMARKGYVYLKGSNNGNGMRKRAKVIDNADRGSLIFDWPAYEAHHAAR